MSDGTQFKRGISLSIPEQDRWIIKRITNAVVARVISQNLNVPERRTLIRLLFQLQSYPRVIAQQHFALSSGRFAISCSPEAFDMSFFTDDGHTTFTLAYFRDSDHCSHGGGNLTGDERSHVVGVYLDELRTIMVDDGELAIEDYCVADVEEMIPFTLLHLELSLRR